MRRQGLGGRLADEEDRARRHDRHDAVARLEIAGAPENDRHTPGAAHEQVRPLRNDVHALKVGVLAGDGLENAKAGAERANILGALHKRAIGISGLEVLDSQRERGESLRGVLQRGVAIRIRRDGRLPERERKEQQDRKRESHVGEYRTNGRRSRSGGSGLSRRYPRISPSWASAMFPGSLASASAWRT